MAKLWLDGRLKEIVDYNEFDALTTYLVWLRLAHFAGHFSGDEYGREQELVRKLITREARSPDKKHLERYLKEWERLESICRNR